ncbi:MAG: hypothetical protein ACXWPM_03335 [Bdellovibrionota bacterium]
MSHSARAEVLFPGLTAIEKIGQPEDDRTMWLDGETIRGFLSGSQNALAGTLGGALDFLSGVRLTRNEEDLDVSVFMTNDLTDILSNPDKTENWKLYGLHFPKEMHFRMKMTDSVLSVSGLDEGENTFNLLAKVPSILPEKIYLRNATMDLTNGEVLVTAGVLGDTIAIVAKAQVMKQKFEGVDLWATLNANMDAWCSALQFFIGG